MVTIYILFVVGIFLLIKGADWIVDGSSSLAKKLGISNLVIGLTIVSFGTTLPELSVNIFAALKGSTEIAFGNAIGSNITNILLILGIVAIIGNVKVKSETIWGEIPFALLTGFVLFVLTGNVFKSKEFLTKSDALILLSLLAIFLYYIFQMAKHGNKKLEIGSVIDGSNWKISLRIILGIACIYFGGGWVVDGAVFIASKLGLSEFLISATIIAIGTSLPELSIAIVSVWKKNIDLTVGNLVGSTVFNTCWVLGAIPLIAPLKIPSFVGFDIAIMFLATLILFIFMFIGEKHELRKVDGAIMVLFYILYVAFAIHRG